MKIGAGMTILIERAIYKQTLIKNTSNQLSVISRQETVSRSTRILEPLNPRTLIGPLAQQHRQKIVDMPDTVIVSVCSALVYRGRSFRPD